MKRFFNWLRRQWRGRIGGWRVCPECRQQTLRWEKDVVLHPEEPPCFGHWQCWNPACRIGFDIEATPLMDQAAQAKGYRDFREFAEENFPEHRP